MNADPNNTDLNSHICFNALATLQNIKNVENSENLMDNRNLMPFLACNFCSSSDHTTYLCPVLSQGEHVKDTSIDNLSRSSVPNGLRVYENELGLHIVSVQKFAKGCRFGPILAPKSHIPIENTRFPLTIFGTVNLDMDGMQMAEFKDLFKIRQIHLDTRNEKLCNWMIHIDPAQYSTEQNLIAYEEDNQIFFAAIEDLDVGDILKVWYSPKYGECMKMPPLMESLHPITKNIGISAMSDMNWLNNCPAYDNNPSNKTEIMLPSIKTIIKPTSYVCYENRSYESSPSLEYATTSNYLSSSYGHTSGIPSTLSTDSTAGKLLNLDGSISNVQQFNELINYDDEDVEQFGKLLNASNECIATDPITGTVHCEKKVYPCKLCDKKYSTMTNIYRHVRAQHKYFLCSLCMNMFELETELKDHINECPNSDDKKPQCSVCMQYFSNSWSLTRHLKIHVAAGECDPEILSDKKLKEAKKTKDDNKDSIDLSDLDKNSQDSFTADFMSLTGEPLITSGATYVPSLCEIDVSSVMPIVVGDSVESIQTIAIEKIENINADTSTLADDKDETSKCPVCNKTFKSKACVNKHLRSVHTVKILTTGLKRSATTGAHPKATSTKRSHLSETQASTTHTGLPVHPKTAKALASKLSERCGLSMKRAKESSSSAGRSNKTVSSDVQIPPLVSFQGTSSGTDSENLQPQQSHTTNLNSEHHPFPTLKNRNNDDLNATVHNLAKKCKVQMTLNADEAKVTTTNQGLGSAEKLHECDLCGKKFSKKYELKRHKTVHEHITYTCPYCSKTVKRKQSITKHLRNVHKEYEHIWNDENFITNLKQLKLGTDLADQSENSNMDERLDESTTINVNGGSRMTNGKILFLEDLDNVSNGNNNLSQIDAKVSSITVDYKYDNNNYTTSYIETNHISTVSDSNGGEIYKNVFLNSNHIKSGGNFISNASIAGNPYAGLHHIQVIGGPNSEDDETILVESRSAVQMLNNQKAISISAQSSLTNIIDDCFFVDDALNCNVALNSPFSDENDVDGFTMTNGDGDCVMNKELLNKFHDRLEEIDDKIDNADFKTIWNHMLDEENLNDDMDNEEAATDSVEESTDNHDFNNVTAVK